MIVRAGLTSTLTFTHIIEGCTPGFWQGGNGSQLWNVENDQHWMGNGTNPYIHTTKFNEEFTPFEALNGYTMMDLVSTGGGSIDSQKAARDVVAAYLNASWGMAFPFTADEVADLWATAVGSGEFAELHNLLAPANAPPNGTCPIP